jgi:hypothetical protein
MNKMFLVSILLLINIPFCYSQSKPKAEYDKFNYMTRDLSRDIIAINYVSVSALEKDPYTNAVSENSVLRPSEIIFSNDRKIKIDWLYSGEKKTVTILEKEKIIREYDLERNLIMISEPNKEDRHIPIIGNDFFSMNMGKALPNYDYRLEILSWKEYFDPNKLITPAVK